MPEGITSGGPPERKAVSAAPPGSQGRGSSKNIRLNVLTRCRPLPTTAQFFSRLAPGAAGTVVGAAENLGGGFLPWERAELLFNRGGLSVEATGGIQALLCLPEEGELDAVEERGFLLDLRGTSHSSCHRMLSLLIGERLRGGKSFPGYFVLSEEYSGRALRASAAGDADGMVINLFAPVAGEAKKAPPTYRPCGKLYFDPKRRLLYQYVLEDGKLLRRYSLVVSSPTFEFGEEKYRVPRRVLVSAGGDVLYVFARLEEAGSVTALVGQGWYQQHLFEQPGCPFIKERLALPDPPPREGLDSFAGGQVGNGRVAARLFGEDTT